MKKVATAVSWSTVSLSSSPSVSPAPSRTVKTMVSMLSRASPTVTVTAAASSELTGYANGNKAAFTLLPKEISGNPLIYPPADVRAKFYTITAGTPDQTRERTRLWTTVKTGR